MLQDQSEPILGTRNPCTCPIHQCCTVLSEAGLLDHLLSEHKHLDLKPVDAGEKAVLTFQENIFPYDQQVCMGIVLYGGKDERSRPFQTGLSLKNSILSTNNLAYDNYFPVLVMGCKAHLGDLLEEDEITAEDYNGFCNGQIDRDPEMDIFLLWLTGPSATRPVHGDMTICDSERINVNGCRMQVLDFKNVLRPVEFLCKGTDFLMVNRGGMNLLNGNGEHELEMELSVDEESMAF